jgi:acetylornithine deacetylase
MANIKSTGKLAEEAINLLKKLIEVPSFSKEENGTAEILREFFKSKSWPYKQKANNLWIYHPGFNSAKPTILLNSHHDTVKPSAGWKKDPHQPLIEEGRLYGLGSNDAGGALVSLIAVFDLLYEEQLGYNLVLAATAEEEISGKNGIESILVELGKIDVAIVGEPTAMQMAIAEKGLMVLDVATWGKSGHAAREEGENAIYKALREIEWFRTYTFDRVSNLLGKVKMSVTQVEAGTQHNVVPDLCHYVVDVRTNELYTNQEILKIVRENVSSDIRPRSTRLNSSGISPSHPLVQRGLELQLKTFGSVTLSDQALLKCPSLKIGPGDSARSHTADEYIELAEIREAIVLYYQLLKDLVVPHDETLG